MCNVSSQSCNFAAITRNLRKLRDCKLSIPLKITRYKRNQRIYEFSHVLLWRCYMVPLLSVLYTWLLLTRNWEVQRNCNTNISVLIGCATMAECILSPVFHLSDAAWKTSDPSLSLSLSIPNPTPLDLRFSLCPGATKETSSPHEFVFWKFNVWSNVFVEL